MSTEGLRNKTFLVAGSGISVLWDCISITGPGITLLMLLTAFSGMWIASKGMINPSTAFWTLTGLALCCSGSSIINNCFDADIDAVMERTKNRALASGRICIRSSLIMAVSFVILSLFVLSIFVNKLSAILSATGFFVYSFIYTGILKRKTPHATEIGGIAGALPPLIGWAAVKKTVDPQAFILFLIILLWQPPHFWSLAGLYRDDYIRAAVPAMPVISEKRTLRLMLIYLIFLSIASITPYFLKLMGSTYLGIAVLLNVVYFGIYIWRMLAGRKIDRILFRYSIVYLSLLFLFMIIDFQVL